MSIILIIDEEVYKSYGEVNPSTVKGYVTSVKEARKNLENLFKDCKEL